ncbi:uncharacterized protein LOC123399495 [Hordeum vulgare subsp. vulgare]|nr:uncharacterized protein LOC123399495 [Hordeum vulgare subsp. vulgare]
MISVELVQCYTQQHGESLFMELNEKGRYIDVRFVDNDDAQSVLAEHSSYPFTVDWTRTIDASQIITPGTVEMYQPPRDRGHYDEEPSVPLPCTNPFPIRFAPTQESNGRVRPIYPPTVQPKAPSPKAPFEKPTWPAPPDRDFFMTNYV